MNFKTLLASIFLCNLTAIVFAQSAENVQTLKQANNPLASIKTFNVHNYYSDRLYGNGESMNTMWFRYAQPIGRVLLRASLPVNTFPVAGDKYKSGLGDLNVLTAYLFTRPTSKNQLGLEPIITAPTATSNALGSGKWQAGIAFGGYFAGNNILQLGFLSTWQHSFAGDDDRPDAQMFTFQPFLMWQLGKGVYMRSTGIMSFDLENDNYCVPLGLGIGKILKRDKLVFNLFMEPQFTVWYKGNNIPKTQLFIGINTQF